MTVNDSTKQLYIQVQSPNITFKTIQQRVLLSISFDQIHYSNSISLSIYQQPEKRRENQQTLIVPKHGTSLSGTYMILQGYNFGYIPFNDIVVKFVTDYGDEKLIKAGHQIEQRNKLLLIHLLDLNILIQIKHIGHVSYILL